MTDTAAVTDALTANDVIAVIETAFWVALGIAILVRVVVAMIRRRPGDIKRDVIAPIFSAGAAQSEAFGWKPALEEELPDAEVGMRKGKLTDRPDPDRSPPLTGPLASTT